MSDTQKNYKDLEKNNKQLVPMFSLKSGESNFSPLKWLLNALSKLQLNMNICYEIIENMDLDSNFEKESILSLIIEKYFLTVNDFVNEPNYHISNFKITQSIIYKKMFMKKRKKNSKKKDILLTDNKKNGFIIDFNNGANGINLTPFSSNTNSKICVICFESQNIFKKIPGTSHEFCIQCIGSYLKQNITTNNVLKIMCPDDCGYKLSESDVIQLLGEDFIMVSKYKKFKLNSEMVKNPNLMWCMTPGCENILQCGQTSKLITCFKCNLRMCFLCKSVWHEGQTCEEAVDSEYKKYIDHVAVKQCPKCKVRIEKNHGCNHMTCVRCHHQFCWICCKKYTPFHYKWYNFFGCPGLQEANILRRNFFCLRRIKVLFEIIGYLIIILLGIALFPLILLILSLVSPLIYYYNNYKGPCFVFLFVVIFILSLLCTPITMIILFFLAIVHLIFYRKIFTLTNED